MKVEINAISDKGLQISEEITASDWQMDSDNIKFVNNIGLNCEFKKIHKEILVNAYVVTHREIICFRCLESADKVVKQNFVKSYNLDKLKGALDIDEDIREEIILSFPMKVLCKDDCKGICSKCGVNLNTDKCKC